MGHQTESEVLLGTAYHQISTRFDAREGILWTELNQPGIPCVNLEFLMELQHHHQAIEDSGGEILAQGETHRIGYSVSCSLKPGVFSLGGQLSLFRQLIRSRDAVSLRHYGIECIQMLHPRLTRFNLPLTTIALVQGDALGGGFEGLLVSDLIIAERGSHLGFPEILFNLFPGMGAYNLLARKVGNALAEKIILSGRIYDAEALYELGVVDVLADPGRGVQAVHDWVRQNERRSNGFRAIQQVRERVLPITFQDLADVVDIWVDAALRLTERDLKVMDRFVRSQERAYPVPETQERMIA